MQILNSADGFFSGCGKERGTEEIVVNGVWRGSEKRPSGMLAEASMPNDDSFFG